LASNTSGHKTILIYLCGDRHTTKHKAIRPSKTSKAFKTSRIKKEGGASDGAIDGGGLVG
jgi:hypothetical protein